MTCAEAQDLFVERLSGPLEAVDSHLADCQACSASYRELADTFAFLPDLAAPSAPELPDFFERLERRRQLSGLVWERRLDRFQKAFGQAVAGVVILMSVWTGFNAISAATQSLPSLVDQVGDRYVIVPGVKP